MNVKEIVSKMTLEEKAGMCSGADFWHTRGVERLGVPAVMVSDGPNGLRKQANQADHLGVNESIEAVCFPAACATSCSFDRNVMRKLGKAIGKECQAEDLSVILGPAVNIKRSPLCGRNFEYVSEDPYVAGELSAAFIQGVQSKDVGTSIKHFAANNQEYHRMSVSSEVDERTLREIYYPPFETAVKKAQPWTVMNSYNRINGIFAGESKELLTDILRDEWGFKGLVVSDWGAVSDRVEGLKAGVDLEMPGSLGTNDQEIIKAVRDGSLSEEILDQAVERILKLIFRYTEHRKKEVFDRKKDHKKAVELAKQCIVLLKNEDKILPLKDGKDEIAVIGGFAAKPRFQGGGSGHINAKQVPSAVEILQNYQKVRYAEGFSAKEDVIDQKLVKDAVEAAKKAKKVVIFAGLPDSFESEGYDRSHMRLPDCQNYLIKKILKVQKNVVVVLHNGSPVEMPWADDVKGIVEAYLCGEGAAEAVTDILYGKTNPCGKLAETFPMKLEDNPSYLNFPGTDEKVSYAEGIFVGYRYYEAKKMPVRFPFGHGLSYTQFEISNLHLNQKAVKESETVEVSVDVKNTGKMAGKEVVQLYVRDTTGAAIRPEKELKGFEAVELEPGEKKTVTMTLNKRSFAWYNVKIHDWYAATGDYRIMVGNSSQNIVEEAVVHYISETELPFVVTKDTILGDLLAHEKLRDYTKRNLMEHMGVLVADENTQKANQAAAEAITTEMQEAMAQYTPIRSLRSFSDYPNEEMEKAVRELNELLK
ncbi:MAG: glycoside hydrolase family 3 C-terminal domain-containing protein [bacterium]|nr:glycoside hydrolase family 3 C-terminal domain-containing protein [bacterium]